MALFHTMAAQTINFTHKRAVVLSALLLAVIASGLPRVEFHTHDDSYHGHVHDAQSHDDPDGENSEDLDEPGNIGVMHAHDIGTSTLTLVSTFNVDIVAHWRADGGVPPPTSKPPDRLIAPLYRPPIA